MRSRDADSGRRKVNSGSMRRLVLFDQLGTDNLWWGRRQTFQRFERHFGSVENQDSWRFVLSGRPGSGKTWWLQFLVRAYDWEDSCCRISCDVNKSIAGQLLKQLLERFPGWSTLEGITPRMFGALNRYGSTSIRQLLSSQQDHTGGKARIKKSDLFATVWQLLLNAARLRRSSLYLWVEDLESATRQDLDLLGFLLTKCRKQHVSLRLILTVNRRGLKAQTLDFLEKLNPEINMRLNAWRETDIAMLLERDYGIRNSERNQVFISEFYRQVGGLQFRVVQTLALMYEQGYLVEKKNYGYGLRQWRRFKWPASLEEVLVRRLERLSRHPNTWRVLAALSLEPSPDCQDMDERSLGLVHGELRNQLYQLHRYGFLVRNGFQGREYQLRHPAIGEVVRGMMEKSQ